MAVFSTETAFETIMNAITDIILAARDCTDRLMKSKGTWQISKSGFD
jgi:hypothetical protein